MIYNANGYGKHMIRRGLNPNDSKNAMIHVAQNDTSKDDYVDYAKQGKKLNVIKFLKNEDKKISKSK